MSIDKNIVNKLVKKNESKSLDFKRENYQFVGATEIRKSELLKDILAFSNSSRTEDAYILIGFEKKSSGEIIINGITNSLDDAHLQQFVNSKTNLPLIFSYDEFEYKNKICASIHIPIQERPFFIKKDYGKLKANLVYIRRGSSTTIAKPDEIFEMGLKSIQPQDNPELKLHFSDKNRTELLKDKIINITTMMFYRIKNMSGHYIVSNEQNTKIMASKAILDPTIYLSIKNYSNVPATDVEIEIKTKSSIDVFHLLTKKKFFEEKSQKKENYSINNYFSHWLLKSNFKKIQPKATKHIDEIYVVSDSAGTIDLNYTIYASNLSEPILGKLSVELKIKT